MPNFKLPFIVSVAVALWVASAPTGSFAQFKKVGKGGLSTLNKSTSANISSDKQSGAAGTIGTIIRYEAALNFGPQIKAALAEFERRSGFFGAFAVHTDSDRFAHVSDLHSGQTARIAALKGCERLTGKKCQIYAVSLPKGARTYGPTSLVSSVAQTEFDTGFNQSIQNMSVGAFAVNGWNSFGWNTGNRRVSTAEVQRGAIENCQERSLQRYNTDSSPVDAGIISKQAMLTCRVVWAGQSR